MKNKDDKVACEATAASDRQQCELDCETGG